MNNNLSGVVIDPGHDGKDSGAIGKDLLEKDYNLLNCYLKTLDEMSTFSEDNIMIKLAQIDI